MEDNNIINSYKNLPISSKRKELGREIAEMVIVLQKLVKDIDNNYSIEPLDALDNLYNGTTSEDEYLSGLYEDVLSFKELLGTYLEKVTSVFYTDDN